MKIKEYIRFSWQSKWQFNSANSATGSKVTWKENMAAPGAVGKREGFVPFICQRCKKALSQYGSHRKDWLWREPSHNWITDSPRQPEKDEDFTFWPNMASLSSLHPFPSLVTFLLLSPRPHLVSINYTLFAHWLEFAVLSPHLASFKVWLWSESYLPVTSHTVHFPQLCSSFSEMG